MTSAHESTPWSTVDGRRRCTSRPRAPMEDDRRRDDVDSAWPIASCIVQANTSRYVRYLDDFPVVADSTISGTDLDWSATEDKIYVVQTQREDRPALHPDDHRPRRPRPRPDMRLRHHGDRRRAVGPPLDHHRHLARCARARPRPHHGRALSVLSARRLPRRPAQGGRGHAHSAVVAADARQHPPGLRLRARAAHHAQVDRQQRRDRRHLGEVAGDARAAAREAQRRAEAEVGRVGDPARRRGEVARRRRRSSTPTGGRRASRARRRSTPRSPPRRSSSTSTTSRTRTTRRCASPARSPSRACRRTACSASTRTTS